MRVLCVVYEVLWPLGPGNFTKLPHPALAPHRDAGRHIPVGDAGIVLYKLKMNVYELIRAAFTSLGVFDDMVESLLRLSRSQASLAK